MTITRILIYFSYSGKHIVEIHRGPLTRVYRGASYRQVSGLSRKYGFNPLLLVEFVD